MAVGPKEVNKGLDFRSLLNYKTVLILLIVVALNVAVFVLLWRLDIFVNSDLYGYGLVFSYSWGDSYWYYNQLTWTFLTGAAALAACSIIPHYLHSRRPSGFSKTFGFLLPTAALIYQVLSLFFLNQVNFVVRYTLYQYGLSVTFDWTAAYDLIYGASFVLMTLSLLLLIIPAVRSLELIKVKWEQEAE